MADPITILDHIRADYPAMSASALVTAGAVLGWGAAWLFFRQEVVTYKAKIEHLQEVIKGTLPVSTYKPIRFKKGRSMIAGFSLLIIGLLIAIVGTAILLSNLANKPNVGVAALPPPTTSPQPAAPRAASAPSPVQKPPISRSSIYNPGADDQRALLNAIIPLKDSLPRKITILRPRDSGAQSVARVYERVFSTAGFDAEQDQQAQTDASQTGQIMMGVADSKNPPQQAVVLADAMRKIGYEMPFLSLPEKLQKNGFAIFVGMNPL